MFSFTIVHFVVRAVADSFECVKCAKVQCYPMICDEGRWAICGKKHSKFQYISNIGAALARGNSRAKRELEPIPPQTTSETTKISNYHTMEHNISNISEMGQNCPKY